MGLVSATDYTTLTGVEATAQVAALLEMASSAVLTSAHGQQIAQSTDEDVVLNQWEGVFYFPQRPVVAVASVTVGGVALVENVDYRWTPGGNGLPAALIRRWNGSDIPWSMIVVEGLGSPLEPFIPTDTTATVTYTHGWDPIPGQVSTAIVSMVQNFLHNNGGPSMTMERVAGWEGRWEAGSSNFSITPDVQDDLDQLCKVQPFGSIPIRCMQPVRAGARWA